MKKSCATDYETYSRIKWELHRPIRDEGLDLETRIRLYESKLAYLERLRVLCFSAVNSKALTKFNMQDYHYILVALQGAKAHLCRLNSHDELSSVTQTAS